MKAPSVGGVSQRQPSPLNVSPVPPAGEAAATDVPREPGPRPTPAAPASTAAALLDCLAPLASRAALLATVLAALRKADAGQRAPALAAVLAATAADAALQLFAHLRRGRRARRAEAAAEAEAARREAQDAGLAAVLGASHEALITCDAAGRVVHVSDAACTLLGCSREEAVGRPARELVPVPPEGAEEGAAARGPARTRTDRHLTVSVTRHGGRSGGLATLVVREAPHATPPSSLLPSASCLTELLRRAPDAVIAANERSEITFFNAGAEALFGWPAREALGKPVSVLMPQPFASSHAGHVERWLMRPSGYRQPRHLAEVTARRKDGSLFPCEISVSHSTVNGVGVFVGIMRDVGPRKERERILAEERRRSETLLTAAVPVSALRMLREHAGHAVAQEIPDASFLVAQVCELGGLAARLEAAQLVGLLEQLHSAAERCLEARYSGRLDRLSHAGGSLLVVGGLLDAGAHLEELACFALDLLALARRLGGPPLCLRLGLHAGPCVLGAASGRAVVYGVWGEAVDAATALAAGGAPGRVAASAVARTRLAQAGFLFEPRGGEGDAGGAFLVARRKRGSLPSAAPRRSSIDFVPDAALVVGLPAPDAPPPPRPAAVPGAERTQSSPSPAAAASSPVRFTASPARLAASPARASPPTARVSPQHLSPTANSDGRRRRNSGDSKRRRSAAAAAAAAASVALPCPGGPLSEVVDLVLIIDDPKLSTWRIPPERHEEFVHAMLRALGLDVRFGINRPVLRPFLTAVRHLYGHAPFHNFVHALDVCHCMFVMIRLLCNRRRYLAPEDQLACLVAALCHDVGHPGTTNLYQSQSKSDAFLKYGPVSTLEKMHLHSALQLLELEGAEAAEDEDLVYGAEVTDAAAVVPVPLAAGGPGAAAGTREERGRMRGRRRAYSVEVEDGAAYAHLLESAVLPKLASVPDRDSRSSSPAGDGQANSSGAGSGGSGASAGSGTTSGSGSASERSGGSRRKGRGEAGPPISVLRSRSPSPVSTGSSPSVEEARRRGPPAPGSRRASLAHVPEHSASGASGDERSPVGAAAAHGGVWADDCGAAGMDPALRALRPAALLDRMRPRQRARFRAMLRALVLATDVTRNASYIREYARSFPAGSPPEAAISKLGGGFSFQEARLLGEMMIKCADLSNAARGFDNAIYWSRRLRQEFLRQGRRELAAGFKVSPGMDTKRSAFEQQLAWAEGQVVFFRVIVIPLFRTIAEGLPELAVYYTHVMSNYLRWQVTARWKRACASVVAGIRASRDAAQRPRSSFPS